MRSPAWTTVALSACVVLAGCATTVDDRPVVGIQQAVAPSPARALDQVLPTSDELTGLLGTDGFMGQLVNGGPDMLLAGVGESEATPADCVGAGYSLQRTAYQSSPVRSVASRPWVGGSAEGPSASGFFGVVSFPSAEAAKDFFAASAQAWHGCNGQTLVRNQPQRGAQSSSKISEVAVEPSTVTAVVIRDGGSTVQRVLGVAADCVVDVEITDADIAAGAPDAAKVARLMLQKIGAS